jgi:hypothetical protein
MSIGTDNGLRARIAVLIVDAPALADVRLERRMAITV